jgi:adenine deaminase
MRNLAELLAVARGDAPADRLFRGGRVADVFTGSLVATDVAVAGGRVVGVGSGYDAEEIVELEGAVLAPGWIDAHVHIESSLAVPYQFARAVVPRGTTTAVTDPHEIANVHGLAGIRYMLDASEGLPLQVLVQAPSCVPATPMGTAGAALDAADLAGLLEHPRVLGLAEVMNFPGTIQGDPGVLAKLRAFEGRPVDGHAPGVSGRALNAYALAGPSSDHECTTAEEALEKLQRGLTLFIREATNARNLDALLPVLTPDTAGRICLCTDDRVPADLLEEGGIDAMLRRVVEAGHDPLTALRLATLNPATFFGLPDRGAVAPGRRADLVVLDDLATFRPRAVYAGGDLVAGEGRAAEWPEPQVVPPDPRVRIALNADTFRIPADGPGEVRVIRAVPDQLVTGHERWPARVENDEAVADPERDLVKIAVLERHGRGGGVGLGFVTGLGLAAGAMAGTVAHDHHNLVVCGASDTAMAAAARAVAEAGGGLAVADDEGVTTVLPLPVGGLMSPAPIEEIRRRMDELAERGRELGARVHDPFMALSFLGLEVIPALKITDQGLVDVERFTRVPLWV